jgi:uncharacterized protein YjiS (DUF1127 family)
MPTSELFLPPRISSTWQPARTHRRLAAAFRLFTTWAERRRQRQALAALDDQMLRDIGVTRVEAVRECEKPFWR